MNRLTQKKQKARNFARAFLRTHELSEQDLLQGVQVLSECCRDYPLVFRTLELSSARLSEKYAAVDDLVQRLQAPLQFGRLLRAVLRYKEFHLLGSILEMLKEEFKKMHGVHEVHVSTSHPLDLQGKQDLEQLISKKIPGNLRFIYTQNHDLIAGIKIQTPLYYWEHSVARTLRKLQHQIESQE